MGLLVQVNPILTHKASHVSLADSEIDLVYFKPEILFNQTEYLADDAPPQHSSTTLQNGIPPSPLLPPYAP